MAFEVVDVVGDELVEGCAWCVWGTGWCSGVLLGGHVGGISCDSGCMLLASGRVVNASV